MHNETVINKPSNKLEFDGAFDSRSAMLILDLSKSPKAISESLEAFNGGRFSEVNEILKRNSAELESLADRLPCDVMFYMANLYDRIADFDNAGKWYERAAALEPVDYRFWINMSSFYAHLGEMDRSHEILEKALSISEDSKIYAMPFYLFSLHYDHNISRSELFSRHVEWGRLVSEKVSRRNIDFKLKRSGKIRIGYVSPDIRKHPVAFFIKPLLENHDRNKFEIYGYGNVSSPDRITSQFSGLFDVYHNIYGVNDDKTADLIINDGIDILVDLAGHTTGDRLRVFAQKPAPIQVTYLGYPDTTGLDVMDYRLTDELAESDDCADYYSEKPIFLPRCFLCYHPYENVPQISELSARKNGFVTFGSFNNSRKINPLIISLWSKVLLAVPGSRMIIKIKGGDIPFIQKYYLKQFEGNGVSADRLEIYGHVLDEKHFDLYSKIDIALDTFPYNGTTTTCEAIWMGAPVVTLVGEHHMSRVGVSLLNKVGLEFFAAKTESEYIKKASALAGNIESLEKIRASMRERVSASGLCDGSAFAKKVECAYERMVSDHIESNK